MTESSESRVQSSVRGEGRAARTGVRASRQPAKRRSMEFLGKNSGDKKRLKGFSLIELAVVLLILALMVGGVLIGANTLRSSQLKSITMDYTAYKSAIYKFQDIYKGLPGDLTDATTYWGAENVNPLVCKTTASAAKLTCNGNGDGMIGSFENADTIYEAYRMWQHLSNAGLIKGKFNGIVGTGGKAESLIGRNVPASRVEEAGWSMVHHDYTFAAPDWFPTYYLHHFHFGGEKAGDITDTPVLTPSEAKDVDNKIDDGKPGQGIVLTYTSDFQPACVTTAVPATAVYAVSNTDPTCTLLLKLGF